MKTQIQILIATLISLSATPVLAEFGAEPNMPFIRQAAYRSVIQVKGTLDCQTTCALQTENGRVYQLDNAAKAQKLFRSGKTKATVSGRMTSPGEIEVMDIHSL